MSRRQSDQYQDIFNAEALRGERIHNRVNWGLFTMVLILCGFVYLIQGNKAGLYGMVMAFVSLLYNLLITLMLRSKKNVRRLSYVTMLLNVLCMTIYCYVDAVHNAPIVVATSAALLLYPVIIFVAALRMDKALIIYTTALCVLSMDGLYLLFYQLFDQSLMGQRLSVDPLSQMYRTVYVIAFGVLIYSVPRSMRRVLTRQEQLRRENDENQIKAQHDGLTGLYNRYYFEQSLVEFIRVSKGLGYKFAILFIDLDGFKHINDTYGHEAGDYTLECVAEDLAVTVRGSDLLARLGGDEFVVLLSNVTDRAEIFKFGERLQEKICRERCFRESCFTVGASIGVAIFPDDSENAVDLMQYADEAMYNVKKTGKGGLQLHS